MKLRYHGYRSGSMTTEKAYSVLKSLDARLSKQSCFAGDDVTIGRYCWFPLSKYLNKSGFCLIKSKKMSNFLATVTRSSWIIEDIYE